MVDLSCNKKPVAAKGEKIWVDPVSKLHSSTCCLFRQGWLFDIWWGGPGAKYPGRFLWQLWAFVFVLMLPTEYEVHCKARLPQIVWPLENSSQDIWLWTPLQVDGAKTNGIPCWYNFSDFYFWRPVIFRHSVAAFGISKIVLSRFSDIASRTPTWNMPFVSSQFS